MAQQGLQCREAPLARTPGCPPPRLEELGSGGRRRCWRPQVRFRRPVSSPFQNSGALQGKRESEERGLLKAPIWYGKTSKNWHLQYNIALHGKKERGPSPEEAIQKLKETETILIKKQEFLEQKIQQELQTAKKHGTKNKRAALQALRRKKRLEQQLAQTDGTLSTLEFQREAIENATTNAEVLRTMELAAQGMKKAYQDMDIDKVDELMADITEQQEVAQQISDAISRPVGFADDVDEDELLEELEELEQEELARELLHVGDKEEEPPVKLPSVPSAHLPAGPAPNADEDKELQQLAEWVS
ncbi:charged multivesicular body protein 4a isoform X1 [Pipistrellus kuhlii]|uniref:charged multivesicular body protein 4a isoform X1 n=1 Tax=Pipistrellus kuhlii TaxID=59472 RepID=UPI00174EFDE6|nr:charged multivesicular body protein 4a isoform X1 [Pipistrellus kuhlii]